MISRKGENASQVPNLDWIEAADNPWGVRVLDVRPVTLTMLSTSADPRCASNAVSFGQDDGTSFIGEDPLRFASRRRGVSALFDRPHPGGWRTFCPP